MRNTRRAAAVASAVLGLVCFGSAGAAQADAGLPIDVVVQLDPSAPRTGDLVQGVRPVEGYAEAPEGIARVDLYVVKQSLTNQATDTRPVSSFKPSAPLGRANFSFAWDSARTPYGVVDLVVVAESTAGRTAETKVLGIRIQRPKATAKPTAAKAKAAPVAAPAAASSSAARPKPAASVARTARTAGTVRTARLALPARVQAAQAEQSSAFYNVFGGATYEAEAPIAASAPRVPAAFDPATGGGRALWASVAGALILLVSAAHVQRAVRVQLAPPYWA